MIKSFSEILEDTHMTDKNSTHTYGQWYDVWFDSLRNKTLNILEVGVCVFGGGGVLSLAEYFTYGHVWAIDIDGSHCCDRVFTHPRISFIRGDAYSQETIGKLGDTKFDIIIDDASHEVSDQMKLLKMLRTSLKDTGFYIVEDCCNCHWLPRLRDVWDLGLRQTIIDMSTKTMYDNTMIRFDPIVGATK